MGKKVWLGFYAVFLMFFLSSCQIQSEALNNFIEAAEDYSVEVNDSAEASDSNSEEPKAVFSDLTEEDLLDDEQDSTPNIEEDGHYTSKEEVSLYIHTYDKLPPNYVTKKEAQKHGWNSKENTIAETLPGMSIGGDYFGNYEDILPKKEGRSYKECDIDYVSGGRNAKRIVYSNDGLIFYTEDHYKTFEQLF